MPRGNGASPNDPLAVSLASFLQHAPADSTTAEKVFEALGGMTAHPFFDLSLALRSIEHCALTLCTSAPARSAFLLLLGLAFQESLDFFSIPRDSGYRREAFRVLQAIFDEPRHESFNAHFPDPLTRYFEARGLSWLTSPAAIVVVHSPNDLSAHTPQHTPAVAFEIGGSCPEADYRFSTRDLDSAARKRLAAVVSPKELRSHALSEFHRLSSKIDSPVSSREILFPFLDRIAAFPKDHNRSGFDPSTVLTVIENSPELLLRWRFLLRFFARPPRSSKPERF